MNINFRQIKDVGVFIIDGELVINNSRAVAGFIRAKVSEHSAFAIDLAAISAIDTAGVQTLMHLKKDLSSRGIILKLINHSQPVIAFFDLYGLAPFFGDKIHVKSAEMKNFAFSYGVRKSEADENYVVNE